MEEDRSFSVAGGYHNLTMVELITPNQTNDPGITFE